MSFIAKSLRGVNRKVRIEDLFSTDLWTGNETARTISTGVNTSTKGGLVWIKNRSKSVGHTLFDTELGVEEYLSSSGRDKSILNSNTLTSFNLNGFDLGTDVITNETGDDYVGWTFRKSFGFFDVISYSGNGVSGRTVPHNLGTTPGCIMVKSTTKLTDWAVYHRSNPTPPEESVLRLDSDNAASLSDLDANWNATAPTSSVFTIGDNNAVNGSGDDYVAYLFAHDTSDSGFIQCGGYTGNGTGTGPAITLGWEPQWLLIKRTDDLGNWVIYDNVRDTTNPRSSILYPNSNSSEITTGFDLDFTSTGFQPKMDKPSVNASSGEYVYIAIRAEGT